MGAGDIFRGVAQGLLGAGSGAANYALERDAELRKQKMLMELYGMKQAMSPLEAEKMQAEIDALNRRNVDGDGRTGTVVDRRIEEMIKQEEIARGKPFTSRQRAAVKSRLLQRTVFKPSGTPLLESEDILDPFKNLPGESPWSSTILNLPRGDNGGGQPPPAPVREPASLPPRNPGETPEQYTARTGIKVKKR